MTSSTSDERRWALCPQHGMAYHKRLHGDYYHCHLGGHTIEIPPVVKRGVHEDRKRRAVERAR